MCPQPDSDAAPRGYTDGKIIAWGLMLTGSHSQSLEKLLLSRQRRRRRRRLPGTPLFRWQPQGPGSSRSPLSSWQRSSSRTLAPCLLLERSKCQWATVSWIHPAKPCQSKKGKPSGDWQAFCGWIPTCLLCCHAKITLGSQGMRTRAIPPLAKLRCPIQTGREDEEGHLVCLWSLSSFLGAAT